MDPPLLPHRGTVLIIPAVSSANVPQLAADLLVHTLKIPFYSVLDHKGLLYPFAGPAELDRDPSSPATKLNGISSSLEVYHNAQFTVLILRSPTLPSSRGLFVSEVLMPLIHANDFSKILLLSSADATRKQDPMSPRVLTLSVSNQSLQGGPTTILDLSRRIERFSVTDQPSTPDYEEYPLPRRIPGSGISVTVLREALKSNLPLSAIVLFAFDGDNIPDATEMATMTLDILDVAPHPEWQYPLSWAGIYGKEQPIGMELGLYG
ncbi:proteasome assembly chaperone 2 [Limtongia smithiae]|uniref:proteasome assembly chaperone 2 n=1 Tax=Limtongia smithiae TaxID=1125753 RepID=UPI0034CD64E8